MVVDDDAEVRLVVRMALERAGWKVDEADNGATALQAVEANPPQLVVLDLGLPGMPGHEVLGRLRASSSVPVILLTARSSEPERVIGLELGADDYLGKPFSPRELVARAQALLRRARPAPPPTSPRLEFDGLVIDTASHEVLLDGEPVRLTAKEFDLLRFLAESPRQVFSKAQLLVHVWNSYSGWQTEATVSEHMHRIRRKIEVDPKRPRRIVTVHGAGYRFDP